jgi:hypothetical protein
MENDDLPPDVLRFLDQSIDSVPHLEALLILWENATEAFTAEQLAARLYVTSDAAARIGHDLTQRGLAGPAGEGRWKFDPAWDPDGERMNRLATTYRRELIRVATLIHSKASPSVRAFARAFDLKKDD